MAKTEDERRMTNEGGAFDGKAGAWENGCGENDEAEREYAMGRTWIKEDGVKTLTSYLIAILMVVWAAPAFAAHWAWVEKEVAPVPWDYTAFPMFMAYDKSDQKLTLVINDSYYGTVQVWKFTAPEWIKVWEGVPDLGELSSWYHFRSVGNIYYDENLHSVVLWGNCPGYEFETQCQALFKYAPGAGFVRITACMPVSVFDETYPNMSISFDVQRQLAVIVGGFQMHIDGTLDFVTIEYDGENLIYVRNSSTSQTSNLLFSVGTSGYDPCTNRVVFYGQRYPGLPLETWEYDGQTWTMVTTVAGPPLKHLPPIGLNYVPELDGLLCLPNDWGAIDSWLYRGKQWQKLMASEPLSGRAYGLLSYNSSMQFPIFYGGHDDQGEFSNQMWELHCMKHCKPLSKP